MAVNGYGECAIATLVAFDGLLRVGELVAIMVRDVSLPNDCRRGSQSRTLESARSAVSSSHPSSRRRASAYIRLAQTKSGTNQTAEISNPDIISLLRRHIDTRPADGILFHFPSAAPADYFRIVLRSVCVALDIDSFNFTPHSLRHGGATHAHMQMGETIEHVLYRGRWQSNSSARTYLQSGAAALITTQLSRRAEVWVRTLHEGWLDRVAGACFGTSTASL